MSTTGSLKVGSFHDSEILVLDQKYFPRPWSIDDWKGLDPNHHRVFKWLKGAQAIGFALFSYLPGDETAHLLKICLLPSFRGLGESGPFWGEICSALKRESITQVYLEVESTNLRAIRFYQKIGFSTLRVVKSYYSDGTNGIMMNLAFEPRSR